MKKIFALLLTVVISCSLFACGDSASKTSGTTSQTPASSSSAASTAAASTPAASVQGTSSKDSTAAASGKVGFFDSSIDYTKSKKYKFVYMMVKSSALYEDFANSFKAWGARMNVTVDVMDTNGDNDLFISSLSTMAAQGYDGFLLDPDMTTYPAVIEKCKELNIKWMPVMGLPYGEDKHLKHPFVGFDYYQAGEKMGEWLINYQKKTWPDAKAGEIGVIGVDYSVVYEISCRIDGALATMEKTYPDIKQRYFHADCMVGSLDSSTAYKVTGSILPTQPQIKYWLIVGTVDDFADGAVTAAIDAGLKDRVVAISMGSPGLIAQWKAGEQTPWKAALSSIGVIYAEPIFCGLYAQVTGQATAESLWNPEWVNKSKGETYANLLLPTIILEHDNYQQYFEWVDLYTGMNRSDYPVKVTLDSFSARVSPPASYAGK